MKHTMLTRQLSSYTGLVVTALFVGCAHSDAPKPLHGQDFVAETQPTSLGRFSQAQSAAGAKEDGMLYDVNFHGGQLNSLGQGKLDLIMKATPDGDVVYVYLNMPHDVVAQRQTAVTAYLKIAGMSESKIIVAEGPNPNLNSPSAYNLSGIYKPDGTSFSGQAAVQTESGGGTAGMGGGK